MTETNSVQIGLDVGALAVKIAVKRSDSSVESFYRFHKGNPEKTIVEIIDEIGASTSKVAITGSGGRGIANKLNLFFIDPAVSLIAACDGYDDIRHIIDIGGGSLSIVDLDEQKRFSGFRTNSLCAAGTGSFLDEQAVRMKLSIDEMSKERNIEKPPRIAARCAVFAKSDLIHRQQEGFSIPEMWSGLCKGMVSTALSTLFRGRKPNGKIVLVGGVTLNNEVVRWLRSEIDAEIVVPNDPHTFSALGTLSAAKPIDHALDWKKLLSDDEEAEDPRRPLLDLKLSNYPSFECQNSYTENNIEVRIHEPIAGDVIVGVDIGSTSTKAAVLNLDGKVLADLYGRTSGDPIDATKRIFATLTNAAKGSDFRIVGTGTTGSGRKMIGTIIGADRIINEITAHVNGAVATDPDVETIFEIGGQDAKFISLREGVPHDSNMNYVCAAGTGSFVEEQAGKLGFKLTEIGDSVMNTEPPYSTDRCTVFMEQDVHALIRKGFEQREVMGSVLYSVVQNYLNKVVGRHPYSKKKICFMGATARNKGLVAAFENLLKAPIAVSPYCHVMGAFGVAKTVLSEVVMKKEKTSFIGLDAVQSEVKLEREVCKLCANDCTITYALTANHNSIDTAPSWGYLCGRDPEEKNVRVSNHFELFRKRERLWRHAGTVTSLPKDAPSIGIPRALLTHTHLPLWRRFFGELGIRVILSKPTNDKTLLQAEDFIGSDYCYPLKLAHGHVRELSANPDVKHIFLPYVTQGEPHDDKFKRSVFCPYNISFPSIAKTAGLEKPEGKEILTAVVNFQFDLDTIARLLMDGLSRTFKLNKGAVKHAWTAAIAEHHNFQNQLQEIGANYLKKLEDEGSDGVVILGRAYNVCDMGANLNLPQKIADLELTALPVDMLPISDVKVDKLYENMYWRYGRKILQAATFVAKHPRLHAVFLTNFGCGPDSFLQSYVERIMHGKPMLMLELDEHSADAGYVTRLEAFKDVICRDKNKDESIAKNKEEIKFHPSVFKRSHEIDNLWMPPMHPYGTSFLAAALRNDGMPAKPLPKETLETFELAKRYCRGTECVPLPSTIGAFLNVLNNSKNPNREAFFMPTAKGPCRFGQYNTLQRMILSEAGYKDVHIESWDDGSGNFGLKPKTSLNVYNAILAADLMYKARCRIRPYAKDLESFDTTMDKQISKMISVIETGGNVKTTLTEISRELKAIPTNDVKKPLVGIVGEIYVRLNPYTNGELVKTIEAAGGEAWTAPLSEWFQYLTFIDKALAKDRGRSLIERLKKRIKNSYMLRQDRILTGCVDSILSDRQEPSIMSTVNAGERIFPRHFDGESILTIGRAIEFAEQGVDLIANCAPFGCMPGTLTSGIFQKLEGTMGVPVVSLFFDGETDLSHLVRTYLDNLKAKKG
ncbi:MAG: hypothetical protein HN337_04610 [Deltaproteobacteria bacterium]|nr:hypothetical protein [Deltaproteobacteria bacterium]